MKLLVVEDEATMRLALKDCLTAEGFDIISAADGHDGLAEAISQAPDLVLMDVMMPGMDGFHVCREIRRRGLRVPILMLTAKGQVDDRVEGLDAGADDYLSKPFSTRELLARIRALLRRASEGAAPLSGLELGAFRVDFLQRQCWKNGDEIHCTLKEIAVLKLLAERRGQAISRDDFLENVWGYDTYPTTRTVDSHVARLRQKIEPDPNDPKYIRTIHGVGYRLD